MISSAGPSLHATPARDVGPSSMLEVTGAVLVPAGQGARHAPRGVKRHSSSDRGGVDSHRDRSAGYGASGGRHPRPDRQLARDDEEGGSRERTPSWGSIDPKALGLGEYASRREGRVKVPDHVRRMVRDGTAKQVLEQLGRPAGRGRHFNFEDGALDALEAISAEQARLPEAVRMQLQQARLFVDATAPARAAASAQDGDADSADGVVVVPILEDMTLLRTFDCLAIPARADYDDEFNEIHQTKNSIALIGTTGRGRAKPPLASSVSVMTSARGQCMDCDGPGGFHGWFWVVHTAAPNIGESDQAEDFAAYSKELARVGELAVEDIADIEPRQYVLHEDMYVEDMGRIWQNSLLAMSALDVEDAIFFPLGMGAFLRKLGRLDARYNDPFAMANLRRRVADQLMAAIAMLCCSDASGATPKEKGPRRVHLCLLQGSGTAGDESLGNHNCFVEAAAAKLQACPELMDVLNLHLNVDSFQLAHDLACRANQDRPLKVGILNGANKKLVGNHWFADGARFAIDENLHRRSVSMARAALLLNFDVEARPRRPGQLRETLAWFGGKICEMRKPDAECQATRGEVQNSVAESDKLAMQPHVPKPNKAAETASKGSCCRRRKTTVVAPKPPGSDSSPSVALATAFGESATPTSTTTTSTINVRPVDTAAK